MQDPNLDTEWNDVLRAKGIIPQKEKQITEEEIIDIVERTVQEKFNKDKYEDKTLDELDEFEDEEDERVLNEYRRKRMEEMKALSGKAKYGDILEISAVDYVQEVNKAGEDVWVILHLYKQGVQLCAIINEYLKQLCVKYPTVKFIKSISTTCVPNYPDKNLPTIFIYYEGDMKRQIIGPNEFNLNIKLNDFERLLAKSGVTPIKPTNTDGDEDEDYGSSNGSRLKAAEDNMLKTIRNGLRSNENDSDED